MMPSSVGSPAVIFDGDDTLWQTQALYEEAKALFFEAMERLGFNPQSVQDTLAQVDVANVATLRFSKHRFPTSMTEVYKYFCLLHGQPIDPIIIDQVREIGYSVFSRTPIVMDGALETLRILKHHYWLCLYTSGDIDVQQQRIASLHNITEHFDALQITERKTHATLCQLIHQHGLEVRQTWSVGNSLRSDIAPAVQLGLHCIWIHGGAWEYDQDECSLEQVWQVHSLPEIPPILAAVDGIPLSRAAPA
jgi:putative hydrolase of the HAD superfamily